MRGVTLLEILIALSILVLMSVFLFGAFAEFQTMSTLVEAKSEIVGMLRDARTRTLASRNNTNYGVHFEETKAVLFEGNTYNALAPSNEAYQLRFARISAINLGGASEIVFARLSGITSASGNIILESTRNASKTETITILATGVVQ